MLVAIVGGDCGWGTGLGCQEPPEDLTLQHAVHTVDGGLTARG